MIEKTGLLIGLVSSVPGQAFETFYWTILISLIFYGILLVQTWMYFQDNQDTLKMRLLVALILAQQTASTVLDAYALRLYMTTESSSSNPLLPSYMMCITINDGISVLAIFGVQSFFTWKVYLATRPILAPALITGVTALLALAAGIAMILENGVNTLEPAISLSGVIYTAVYAGLAMTSDLAMTAVLVYRFQSFNTSITRATDVMRGIVLYVVIRGILVTLVQMVTLIVNVVVPTIYSNSIIRFSAKIYLQTMISMLNNRPRLRQTLGAEIPIPDPVVASARSEYGMLTRNTKGSDDAVY